MNPDEAAIHGSGALRALEQPDPDDALVELGELLRQRGYAFTTITPASHQLVNLRPDNGIALDLPGAFGWNRPFFRESMPEEVMLAAERAGVLAEEGSLLRSRVRLSTIAGRLIVHSGFPTVERDAVFFGPDTYRFVRLLEQVLEPGGALLELGCGSGAAALCLGGGYARVAMTDVNPQAIRFARINARLNPVPGAPPEVAVGDLFAGVEGDFDAIVANPPFMIDSEHRLYRDGGMHGIDVAVRMFTSALARLAPGGRLVLYTGVPIVAGADPLHAAVREVMGDQPYAYDVLDVDVFGQELADRAYARVERIALVAVIADAAPASGGLPRRRAAARARPPGRRRSGEPPA